MKCEQDDFKGVEFDAFENEVVLPNLKTVDAELIRQDLSQSERLRRLNEIAIIQMKSILGHPGLRRIK